MVANGDGDGLANGKANDRNDGRLPSATATAADTLEKAAYRHC